MTLTDLAISKLRAENAFEPIAREFIAKQANRWSNDYASYVLRRLDVNIFPDIGQRPIATIDPPELLQVIRKIESRGAHEMAHRILQLSGLVFRYGIATGKCVRNPAADLRGALTPHKPKRMAAVEPGDLPELLHRIDAYDSLESGGDRQTRLALQLLATTFVRTTELRKAEWPEFDLVNALWTIPPERAKMHDAYLVPLSRQSLQILADLKQRPSRAKSHTSCQMRKASSCSSARRGGRQKVSYPVYGGSNIASTEKRSFSRSVHIQRCR